jgi:FAD dependent monooxygenase
MTPNIGQGANSAMEDAATLSNLLHDLLFKKHRMMPPSDMEIDGLLDEFARRRISRVTEIYKASRFLVRFQARDGFFKTLLGRYYAPYARELPADIGSKTIADGASLSFIPLPERSGPGWVEFSAKERRYVPIVIISLVILVLALIMQYNLVTEDLRNYITLLSQK